LQTGLGQGVVLGVGFGVLVRLHLLHLHEGVETGAFVPRSRALLQEILFFVLFIFNILNYFLLSFFDFL
jgi:hypothetical protein